jgi:cytochrome c nitrite reductase small subunit
MRRTARVGAAVLLAALLGTALGVGGYTLVYADATSYLSTDPRACMNCHIMRPQFDGWQKASHHGVAGCVDCHLPPSGIPKLWAKAVNGWNHSKAFTLQDFPEPIRITARNAELLQENCLRCHGEVVHGLVSAGGGRDALQCVHCHRSVGHGPTVGLGGADRGWEEERR